MNLKLSDEDMELISALLAVTVTSDSSGLLGDSAVAEIRALRKVAEAAKEYVLSSDADEPGWESDYDALRAALKEAGYGA